MLSLHNINYSYSDIPIIKALSLNVEDGEIACLLGSSGCGKSTLLRLIAGLEEVKDGTISLNNNIISSPSHHLPAEQRDIGLVFQHPSLFPHLNVMQNVMFGLRSHNKADAKQIAADLLDAVRFNGARDAYPHMLSGGQQQRVALARTLAPSPALLLLDEPFANLDHNLRDKVRSDVFSLLQARDTTTLMVTHDPDEALMVANTIHLLGQEGVIVQSGTPRALYDMPANAEVAHFFGEANILSPDAMHTCFGISTDSEVMIRPESIAIVEQGDTPAEVTACHFLGHHHVLELRINNEIITVSDCQKRDISVGDSINIALDASLIHSFQATPKVAA